MATPSSYAWSYTLQNAAPVASAVTVLTPGFNNPGQYKVSEAQVTHDGKVLQPAEFVLAWAADFSNVAVTNNTAKDWLPQSAVAVVVTEASSGGDSSGEYLPIEGGTLTGPLSITRGWKFEATSGGFFFEISSQSPISETPNVFATLIPDSFRNQIYLNGLVVVSDTIEVPNIAAGALTFSTLPVDALDDAAAATAGVAVGGVYRNGSVLMVRAV